MTAGDVKFQRDTSGHNAFNIDPNSYEVYTGNGNKMDKTAKLELEHYYKVRMTLKMIAPGECFLWSANPVPTVESPNGPDDAVIVGRTADGDPIVEYTYKTPCHRKYESLTLTGIKAPVNGEKPSPSAPSLTGTGTDLDTALHAWIDVNNDRLMGADDLFHIGQTYRAVYEITTKRSTVDLMITGPAAVTVNAGTAIAVSGQFDFGTQHDTTEGVFVTVEFTASAEPTAVDLGTYTYDMTEGPAPFNEGGNTEAMFWLYLVFGEAIGGDGNDNFDLDKDGNLDIGQYEEDGKKYIKRLDSTNLKGTYVIHALPEMVTACQNGKVDYYSSLSFVFSKESSYNVHFEMNGHGQQFPDQIVQAGQRVIEWNAQPEAHWFLVGWYIDPAFMNRYVFSAPVNSDLTLYAKWINLVDVEKSNYFCEPVEWAVYQEVTNGVDATHFAPGQTCTRGQVVTFLWRAKGCPAPALTENPFNDVQESNFFYKAVLWAVEHGITTGTSADTFSPSSGCTRAQVVAFLWRTEGKPVPTSSENPFTDVPTGKYYTDAVLWAVEKEITKGTAADKFSPDNVCTRGQIVTFLYRAFGPKG